MIHPIDGVNRNSNAATEYAPTFPHKTVAAQDSVVLSLGTQAKLLEQQGLSIDEIASALGIPTTTVQSDLGIAIVSPQTKVATA
jgi:hypothetical protein